MLLLYRGKKFGTIKITVTGPILHPRLSTADRIMSKTRPGPIRVNSIGPIFSLEKLDTLPIMDQ